MPLWAPSGCASRSRQKKQRSGRALLTQLARPARRSRVRVDGGGISARRSDRGAGTRSAGGEAGVDLAFLAEGEAGGAAVAGADAQAAARVGEAEGGGVELAVALRLLGVEVEQRLQPAVQGEVPTGSLR